MSSISIEQRNLGVTFRDYRAHVCVWAPKATHVSIFIEDLERSIPLISIDKGYWILDTEALHPGSHYKFLLDDLPFPDPVSLAQPKGVHGSSQACDTNNFRWQDQDWRNPFLKDYIIYELHVGTFSEDGDFDGVINKLDYLVDLGITAIELMPVAQFPGERNWGYDGVFPFAVQYSYGGAKGLQRLVDACHQKGLAIILDVVYNHFGPEGNYLNQYGMYCTEKYKTPWGGAVNFDDAYSDEVRRYFIENVLMWFRDFHIDALRLDAAHGIKDFSPRHILAEIRLHVDQLMEYTGRNYWLIVECDLNDTRYIDKLDSGGYGMDSQWVDEFHHALRVAVGQPPTGYYSDFNGLEDFVKAYRDAYVYTGQYSEYRKKTFGTPTHHQPGETFVVFCQNHDQIGNRMLGERAISLVGLERAKLMAGAVLLAPYIPLLFMGEEWGTNTPFLYFVSHSDSNLIMSVREGRKREFADFYSEANFPDPAQVETFLESKLLWNWTRDEHHNAMFHYYKHLIALRKAEPSLSEGNRKCLRVTSSIDDGTLYLIRTSEASELCIVFNFSSVVQRVHLPACIQSWFPIFNSADRCWGGPGANDTDEDVFLQWIVPHSLIIYKSYHVQPDINI